MFFDIIIFATRAALWFVGNYLLTLPHNLSVIVSECSFWHIESVELHVETFSCHAPGIQCQVSSLCLTFGLHFNNLCDFSSSVFAHHEFTQTSWVCYFLAFFFCPSCLLSAELAAICHNIDLCNGVELCLLQ